MESKTQHKIKSQTHRIREQIGGCQRQGLGGQGEMGEEGQRVKRKNKK